MFSCNSKWSKTFNKIKNGFATLIEDQTELEIRSQNADFANQMARKARLQKQNLTDRHRSAVLEGNHNLARQLEQAIWYQETRESQWATCKEATEKWVFSPPVYRVTHSCPEYQEFEV